MESIKDLVTGFQFDRWANTLWIEALQRKDATADDWAIMQHILAAQEIWLSRCQGHSLSSMPAPEPTVDNLEKLTAQWLQILSKDHGNPTISFKRLTGETHELTLHEIMHHVINHGTYHRGELRGVCRARGDNDFPETDRMRFVIFR